MQDTEDKCSICFKPKRQSGRGTLTQWIVVCRCDAALAEQVVSTKICRQCRKQIIPSRPGSFTQWIFGPNRCACSSPDPAAPGTTDGVTLDDVPGRVDSNSEASDRAEAELALKSHDFPMARYKPLLELGRGASGTVYLCRDRLIGNRVAVKVLHELTGEQLLSFQQEARISSRLDHPNIVRILDFGPTEGGAPYMVMQYSPGVTLEEHLSAHGPLDELCARAIFAQVCRALEHAHARDVFHRDLKPSNILLAGTADGEPFAVKLIDFGVAQIIQKNQEPTIVQGRTIAGTPSYMPPELVAGGRFDARSDLYSLSCVIFEAVTGRPPFRGENAMALLAKHAQEPAPLPSEAAGRALPFFDDLLSKGLAKQPEERFQSAGELEEVLQPDAAGEPESAQALSENGTDVSDTAQSSGSSPASRSNRMGRLFIGVAAGLSIGGLLLAIWWHGNSGDRRSETGSHSGSRSGHVAGAGSEVQFHAQLKKDAQSMKMIEKAAVRSTEFEAKAAKGDAKAQVALGLKEFQRQDYARARYWFSKAAAQGDGDAQANLGFMYLNGRGVKRDYQQALMYYKQSADNGSPLGQGFLGFMYRKGLGVKKNYEEALRYFRSGAAGGDVGSLDGLGYMYQHGEGVSKDFRKALECYRQAVAKDYSPACYNLGTMYENGQGVERDLREAARLYQLAVDKNHTASFARLAVLYQDGLGVRKNVPHAIKLYQAAADRGDASAQNNLGFMYQHGMGTARDLARAVEFYEKAVRQGDPSACNNLAFMYQHGLGVPKDYKKAFQLFQKAAEAGRPSAFTNMAYMYSHGLGVEKSYAEAARCLEKAAGQGYARGQANLARMYMDGLGMPRNYAKAFSLAEKAAAQGDAGGLWQVGYLYENGFGVERDLRAAQKYYAAAASKGEQHARKSLLDLYRKHPELSRLNKSRSLH